MTNHVPLALMLRYANNALLAQRINYPVPVKIDYLCSDYVNTSADIIALTNEGISFNIKNDGLNPSNRDGFHSITTTVNNKEELFFVAKIFYENLFRKMMIKAATFDEKSHRTFKEWIARRPHPHNNVVFAEITVRDTKKELKKLGIKF